MVIRLTLLERIFHRLHLLPTPVMDAFGGVLFGHLLAIAVRRGVFEELADGRRRGDELAKRTGCSPEALRIMMEALAVGGYVVSGRNGFALSAEGRKWCVSSSPFFVGHLIRYFETLYARWARLEHALEHGRPVQPYYETFAAEDWETYVLAMGDLARLLLPGVLRGIRPPGGASRLLDIGGSHGLYSLACCRRWPNLHATVMDFEPVRSHALLRAQAEGLGDRVTFLAGDFRSVPLPAGQDVVLMFNVIHGLSEWENRHLMGRALQALTPGGKLYVLDQMEGQRGTSDLARLIPLMVGMNLLNEIGGRTYRPDRVEEWCVSASSIRRVRLRMPGVTMLEVTR